eukprot:Opistho-1_new@10811
MARYFAVAIILAAIAASSVGAHDPDEDRSCDQLIAARGYPVETHTVQTEDGYLLTTFRIPHGKDSTLPRRGAVLLAHGILDSSATWVLNSATDSLSFVLADKGYDVWLMNARGNDYSQGHVSLKPSDNAFWDFTFDEQAKYDVPANIDYILAASGFKTLSYVGHSQGCTQMLAMLSYHRPDIALKVDWFVALAPVAHIGHTTSLLIRALAALHTEKIFELLGVGKFVPGVDLLHKIVPGICTLTPWMCESVIYLIAGFDKQDLDQTRLPVYTAHFPASTSVRNLAHWAQMVRSGEFQLYDFGSDSKNVAAYGQKTPPNYPVERVGCGLAILSGGKDDLADPKDVQVLVDAVREDRIFNERAPFAHLDFVWGKDAGDDLYPSVVEIIASPAPGKLVYSAEKGQMIPYIPPVAAEVLAESDATPSGTPSSKADHTLPIVLGTVGAVAALAVVAGLVVYTRRRARLAKEFPPLITAPQAIAAAS